MCREPWLINLWFNGTRWTRSEDRYFGYFWVDNFVEQIRIDLENNLAAILRKYDKCNGTRNYNTI